MKLETNTPPPPPPTTYSITGLTKDEAYAIRLALMSYGGKKGKWAELAGRMYIDMISGDKVWPYEMVAR